MVAPLKYQKGKTIVNAFIKMLDNSTRKIKQNMSK